MFRVWLASYKKIIKEAAQRIARLAAVVQACRMNG
jgi:hypothetical protein